MPGAFNGLVARAVAQAGFEATYVSGAGVAAGMGLPDVGLAGKVLSLIILLLCCLWAGGTSSSAKAGFEATYLSVLE